MEMVTTARMCRGLAFGQLHSSIRIYFLAWPKGVAARLLWLSSKMWQLGFLTSIITLYGAICRADSPAPQCKNIPGSPGWPSDTEWARLNTAVGGNMLKPQAPAANYRRNSWHTAEFHLNHPTSVIWQNWSNYSCAVGARTTCRTTGYPIYVVAATEWSHVKAAVDFARTKNIRLNIKATGHDFLGR
jgi:hypothetical protein